MQKNAAWLVNIVLPAGCSSDVTEGYIEDIVGCFLLVLRIVYDVTWSCINRNTRLQVNDSWMDSSWTQLMLRLRMHYGNPSASLTMIFHWWLTGSVLAHLTHIISYIYWTHPYAASIISGASQHLEPGKNLSVLMSFLPDEALAWLLVQYYISVKVSRQSGLGGL